ncbi:MAG: hypothetical protein LBF51_09045, partial [Zoogloeaceae bacterium]|nr:hypothetical protein [Zoogloeaceae bacterium]
RRASSQRQAKRPPTRADNIIFCARLHTATGGQHHGTGNLRGISSGRIPNDKAKSAVEAINKAIDNRYAIHARNWQQEAMLNKYAPIWQELKPILLNGQSAQD